MLEKRMFSIMAVVLPLVGIAAMLPLAWLAINALAGSYHEYAARDARANANLLKMWVQPLLDRQDYQGLDRLLKEAREGSHTRFTIVDASGKVLADSDEDAARMEKHQNRQEVAAALGGEDGLETRKSATLGEYQLYVAIPATSPDGPLAIRAAVGLGELETRLWVWRRWLGLGAAIGFIFMVGMSLLVAWLFTRPLVTLANGAERFSRGELGYHLLESGPGEIRRLAVAMNRMARELDQRFTQLERQRKEMQAVLSSMDEGVLAVGRDNEVMFMNKSAEQMLGVTDARASGRFLGESVRQPELLDFMNAILSDGEEVEREIRVETSSGTAFLLAKGGELRETAGTKGKLIVLRNVTRIRQLERMRRDFVANVSHELRTPTTAIQASLETLLDGGIDDRETAREFLGMALRNSHRLGSIISDLLLLSGLESGKNQQRAEGEIAELKPTLEAALFRCRALAAKREITVELSCPDDLKIRANHRLLEQAMLNLVDNAIRHGGGNSRVLVEARAESGWMRISVTDNGPGIESKHAERIFERFYRAGGDREGSGLGLAIVKHIAMAHGGNVTLASEPGRGSVFTLSIPLI